MEFRLLIERFGFAALALKECAGLYLGVLLGRRQLDLKLLAYEFRTAGLAPLPVVTLVAAAVGLILGIQVGDLLEQVNIPGPILGGVVVSVAREFAPLLTGIFVAGRSGVALATRIASMQMNRELDGLMMCGVNPIHYTVGPSLLAMLLMSFTLAIWTLLVILGMMALFLWSEAAVSLATFFNSVLVSMDRIDLLLAAVKSVTYALLIALIAAVNGSCATRDADGVSGAATRTMIGALTAIILADLAFAITVE